MREKFKEFNYQLNISGGSISSVNIYGRIIKIKNPERFESSLVFSVIMRLIKILYVLILNMETNN